MNHQRVVQFAVMCLQELDAQAGMALSFQEISDRRGIPLPECTHVIRQLSHAGIVELADAGRVVLRRSIEELTAMDILQAVWTQTETPLAFQALAGSSEAARRTLEFVQRSQVESVDAGING